MNDPSNSQHTNPNSTYPPPFSPSAGNHPPPPPSPPPPPPADHDPDLEDDADSTTAIENSRRKTEEEINLLYDILDFHNKNGKYPDNDYKDLQEFNEKWVERRTTVYSNELVALRIKIVELHIRFLKNILRKFGVKDVEDGMDPIDVEIYRLSYRVWGKEDSFNSNDDERDSKDKEIKHDSGSKLETNDDQETEDLKDLKDSSEKDADDDHDENDSKDSSSNASNDPKDSSEQETNDDNI